MLEQVRATISRYAMLAPGARVIVAVSGGPDSVCLLHVLRELDIRVTGIAHINHQLRGQASDEDQSFVEGLARDLGLPFYVTAAPPAGGNLEQAARRGRRKFFDDLLQRGLADRIALGHTQDDQAETVMFRLLRGAGLAGLAGVLPVTAEGLIRPLLATSRDDVTRFLDGRGIPWREDASNRERRFARNRLRHELLPGLTADWNPQLRQSLSQLADLAYEEERWWASEIAGIAREMLVTSSGAVEVRAQDLAGLPRAAARRLVRHAIRVAKGSLRGIQFGHIESVLALLEGPGTTQLPGIRGARSFDWIRLEAPARREPFEGPVAVPGRRLSPDGNSMICLDVIGRKQGPMACATLKADLSFRQIPESLELRGWRAGDRYCPVGHASEWKLKELFQRQRVPSWRRPFWPILCWGDKILWARDFGPSREFAEISERSARLRLRVIEVRREDSAEG